MDGKSDARVRMPSVIVRRCSVQYNMEVQSEDATPIPPDLHIAWPSIAHRDHNAPADLTLDMHFRALGYNHVLYVLRTAAGVTDARANAARRVSGGTYSSGLATRRTMAGPGHARLVTQLTDVHLLGLDLWKSGLLPRRS